MKESTSLFAELKGSGYSACLMTTFSINFSFYEDVLLRRMIASGISHHVVLVDKGMCLTAMQSGHPQRAGSHYVLAPMDCQSAFHPKIIMLLGEKKGFLAVGSNNITLSGYGQNLEITNGFRFQLDNETEHLNIFRDAFGAIKEWIDNFGKSLPESVIDAVKSTTNLCPWLKGANAIGGDQTSNTHFFYSSGTQKSLWDQVTTLLPSNINTAIGVSAYFDNQLRLLNKIVELEPQRFHIGVQPSRVSAPPSLVNTEGFKAVDVDALLQQNGGKRYSHVKALYLTGNSDLFVSGSANLSYPGWLARGPEQNAEAVIALTGTKAKLIAEQLGIAELVNAPGVESIATQESTDELVQRDQVELLVVEVNNSCIEIPISEDWPDGHSLACIDQFDRFEPVDAVKNPTAWNIDRKDFARFEGKVIFVVLDDEVLAKVIVILKTEVLLRCTSVKARSLTEAFLSLQTDSPNLQFIFNHLDRITRESAKSNKLDIMKKKPSTSGAVFSHTSRTTLIESLVNTDVQIGKSGRPRIGTSDVQLTLDMLAYVIGRDNDIDINEAFGEDALGRNEEELMVDEDTSEIETSTPTLCAADVEKYAQQRDRFKIRLKSMLDREIKRFELLKEPREDELEHHITISLTFAALAHEMIRRQGKGNYIGDDFISMLNNFVFSRLLNDLDPIAQSNNGSIHSIYSSEEWGKLIAYSVWIAFESGVALRTRLPISASKVDQNSIMWQNACWIYLAQRLAADEDVRNLAAKLLCGREDEKSVWLKHMVCIGEELNADKVSGLPKGFTLAKSPYGAFDGYRVVDVIEREWVYLSSLNLIKQVSSFKIDKLELLN